MNYLRPDWPKAYAIALVLMAGCAPRVASHSPPPRSQASYIGPCQYVNVTTQAGIRFRHDDCRKGTATMMEQAGPGCGLIDYNCDGWPDLYFPNGRDLYGRGWKRQNALYRNNRDGTFTDVTDHAGVPGTGYGQGVA